MDLRPLGLTILSDQEFDESLVEDDDQNTPFTSENWMDPRKGDLFALISPLLAKRSEEQD